MALETIMDKWRSSALLRGTGVFLAGNVVVNLGGFIYHVIIARLLGPVDYGILGSLIGLTYLVSIPTGAIDLLTVRAIASFSQTKLLGKTKSFLVYLCAKLTKWLIGLAVVLAIVTMPVTHFLHLDSPWGVILVWLGLYLLITSVIGLAVLRVLLQFSKVVVNQILVMILKIVLSTIIILVGVSSYLGAQLGVTLALLAGLIILAQQLRPVWQARLEEIKPANLKLRSHGWTGLLFSAAFISMYSLDVVLVRHFLPQFEAGIYSSLVTAGKIVFFALSPIAVVLLPIVARKANRPQTARADLLNILLVALGGGLVVVLAYFGLAKVVINILFTSKFDSAAIFLPWFGLAMWGYSLANIFGNFLMALNKTRVITLAATGLFLEVGSIALFHASLWQVVWSLTIVFWILAGVLFGHCLYATKKEN